MISRMRRFAGRGGIVLALLVAALALAACGSSGGGSGVSSRLLSLSDLPAGWSAAGTSPVKLTRAPCLSGLARHPRHSSYESAAFVEGTSIPNFGEVLASGSGVSRAWAQLEHALGGCHSATLRIGPLRTHATIRPLGFPRIGRRSLAYSWTIVIAGITITSDLVVFQAGRLVGYISYADLGKPPLATVAAFARAAAAKAQRGTTAPVPDSVSIASTPVRTAATPLGAVGYRSIGHGPPLLLLMGYGGTMEAWPPQFVDALAREHRVIALDNAGIGQTAGLPAPLTIDAMADQASALIKTLRLGPTDVLGWSMGSMIAQALAVRDPAEVSRLVLCASFPGDGTAVRPSRAELNAFESGKPKAVVAALFPADQTAAANAFAAATSSYSSTPTVSSAVLAAQRHAVDGWWDGDDPGGRSARIAVPTLIADGTADRLDPTANSHALATLIAGSRLQLYPDAGHAFLFQDAAAFLPLVESFLEPKRS